MMKSSMWLLRTTKVYRPSQRPTLQRHHHMSQCQYCIVDRVTMQRRRESILFLENVNGRYSSRYRKSFSSFSSSATTAAATMATNQWNDSDDDDDEITFMRKRQQQPNLTRTKKDKESIYESIEDEREIRALNKKHRFVRIIRDDPDPQSTLTFEQLEMRRVQLEQLQEKHYLAAMDVIQLGNELFSMKSQMNEDDNSDGVSRNATGHITHPRNSDDAKKKEKTKNTTKNYSKILHQITAFTHSYFMLVNHLRIYENFITDHRQNAGPNIWYQPEYRTTTFEATNVALDVLQHILQEKISETKPKPIVQVEIPKYENHRSIDTEGMQEAELMQYEVDIHEGYINDKTNASTNSDSTGELMSHPHTEVNDHDEIPDDSDDDEEAEINMISKNDTMWIYNPGIIYNPLIQIWKHMSIHHHNNGSNRNYTPPITPSVTQSSNKALHLDGRIIAPEIAVTLAMSDAMTMNESDSVRGGNDRNGSTNNRNELRSAQQVMEQFQLLVLSAIEYTYYTKPSLLRQDLPHQSKNPKKVPYKLFYNSATFNMILEVIMLQHRLEVLPPPTTKTKATRKKKNSFYHNSIDMCSTQSELTAAIMQNSFIAINDAVRKCIQQLQRPTETGDGSGEKKQIGILEAVVNNYDKYLEDLYERYWTYPTPPKVPVWKDEIEEVDHLKEDIALQRAALAGHLDENGNAYIPETEDAIPIRYTTVNATEPLRDTNELGLLFRPDIHTYNLFMKTWALKCHDVDEAAVQVHRIYKDLQQEGFELAPNVETYNVMFHFYASHPDRFVHVVERLIQYLIDKEGLRNVQLLHWYYAIETYTAVQKHKFKAKEYLENMIYSSHHHKFLSKNDNGPNPYANVTIIAEDDDDLQSIAMIQRAAQLLMNMYRKDVQHHLDVINDTQKHIKDVKQFKATTANSKKEIDVAMRSAFDIYIKLKETGFLEFSGEELDDDGYLKYRDEIRGTFMEIYAYAGQMENAMKIFHYIVRTNISNYVTLIDAYGKHDDIDGAESMYDLMITDPNITQLNCDIFTTLMNGYANSTKYPANQLADSIIGLIRRMENEPKCHNIRPNTATYNELLKCLCDISVNPKKKKSDVRFLRALSILDEMESCMGSESDATQNGEPLVKPTIPTYLKIVQTGLKIEDFDGVMKVVERMAMAPISDTTPTKRFLNSESNHSIFHMFREVHTFEALEYMIKLLNCLNQWADEKLTLLRPTAGTYSVLYKACVDLRQLNRSKSSKCKTRSILEGLYEQMKGANINPNHSTYTELIDYYTQSKKREDMEFANDLLIELEAKNDPSMRSDERQYHALFYGYLNNIGDTAAAAQILFRYTKGYLDKKIKDRPSGLLYQTILKSYLESDELIKAALFVDQIHLLQRDEPILDNVKGLTIHLDKYGVPHHLGPDVVTVGHLIDAIKSSTWMDKTDKNFYKRLVTKHSDAIKRFHRRRIRIKRKAFLYM